jgi:glutamyl-tRNA synthetase
VRALSHEEFIKASAPWVCPWQSAWRPLDREPSWREDQFSAALYARVASIVQERVATLGEIPAMVEFFFLDEARVDEASFAKVIADDPLGPTILENAIRRYELLTTWDAPTLHAATVELGEGLGLALRKAQAPIRCAVTGTLIGPPLFESLEFLGRKKTVQRLRVAAARCA